MTVGPLQCKTLRTSMVPCAYRNGFSGNHSSILPAVTRQYNGFASKTERKPLHDGNKYHQQRVYEDNLLKYSFYYTKRLSLRVRFLMFLVLPHVDDFLLCDIILVSCCCSLNYDIGHDTNASIFFLLFSHPLNKLDDVDNTNIIVFHPSTSLYDDDVLWFVKTFSTECRRNDVVLP